jgi:hypothetical protein
MKKIQTKHLKKLKFDINKLIRIYFAEIGFYINKRLLSETNILLSQDLYLILKNLDLFEFYLDDKGYFKREEIRFWDSF